MEKLFRELRDSGSKNYDAIVVFSIHQAAAAEATFKVLNLSAEEKDIYKRIYLKKLENEIVTDEGFEKFKSRI